jgi:acylphosphatase
MDAIPPQPPSIVRRHVYVSGRVQGVFFRDICSRLAISRGVTGWVRNTRDGRVEAVFEGEAPAVDQMVDWCRQGPRGAIVTGIQVDDEPPEGLPYFRVR